ncbi:GNAT family N-acetyltransferase [Limnoglobus roseus]|uniref:N-acetyltransferase n=1 Tax=Limnoglobus roseus TaxID=2598579 RepID=A0A5C1AEG7_9BACT|nr:GNAT family protein [Limnoglobus roseus]QEL15474.1 N-acetyltransferase [Limnoglobus roseus]
MEVVPLTGRWARLVPLDEAHREPLRRAAGDDRIWEHTLTRASGPGFDPWFDDALAERAAGRRVPFAVCRAADGRWVGSTSYLDLAPRHRRVEIGSTWYHPDVWATAVNPESKLLLLAHAFEAFGVNRVALVTDVLNARSQAAIAKLGAVREGVLRSHMISQGGRVRDSVMFSIVAAEWPSVRAVLRSRLEQGTGSVPTPNPTPD